MPRTYPENVCANPSCELLFTPKHGNQLYCSPNCQINHNNDRAKREREERFYLEAPLRNNDKLLEAIYKSEIYQKAGLVPEKALLYYGVNLDLGSWHENLLTNNPILWSHAYGLEMINEVKRDYVIHYRTKF